MLRTSKYANIEKILAEVDDLLQQIGPEIIEQSPSLKKLKFETGTTGWGRNPPAGGN